MKEWEIFEIDCCKYLNSTFGKYASFVHQGGADSTRPDILVETVSGDSFYIEAKASPAQCGQFVLLPDIETNTFVYSKANANRINSYAEEIMDYMNDYFDEFREAGTRGKNIEMPHKKKVFSSWIMQVYKSKGVRFFITNNYTIFPIEELPEYLEISATYRIKRSGSTSVGKSRITSINKIITNDYPVASTKAQGDKLFATSSKNLHNQRFVFDGYEYMFSDRDGVYEIRKLSNTYNANVIFSVELNTVKSGISKMDFINYLK